MVGSFNLSLFGLSIHQNVRGCSFSPDMKTPDKMRLGCTINQSDQLNEKKTS